MEEKIPYFKNKAYRAENDNQLKNELYALICPRLELNESRGSNGHSKTQRIVEDICLQMDEWLEKQ